VFGTVEQFREIDPGVIEPESCPALADFSARTEGLAV